MPYPHIQHPNEASAKRRLFEGRGILRANTEDKLLAWTLDDATLAFKTDGKRRVDWLSPCQ
jgi:hypothetical protein